MRHCTRFFEWDNSVAAQKYRENQASQIATSVRVIYEPNGNEEPIRVSVQVEGEERRQYLTTSHVMSSEDLMESAREELQRMLNGAARSLQSFENAIKNAGKSTKQIKKARKALDTAMVAVASV